MVEVIVYTVVASAAAALVVIPTVYYYQNSYGTTGDQPPTWEELKAKILEAIKKDEPKEVFEALLADVSNFMTELKRTEQLDAISIELQDDGALFFQRRNMMNNKDSKRALQKIVNILKAQ